MDERGAPAIGPPARDDAATGGSGTDELRRFLAVAVVIGLLGIGALLAGGSEAQRYVRRPPVSGFAGVWLALGWGAHSVLLLGAMVLTGVPALLALLFRRWWLVVPFVMVAGYAIGLYGGMQVLPALGVAYHAPAPTAAVPTPRPIPLVASGSGSVGLTGVDGVTALPGRVACHSAVGSSTGWVDVRGVAEWRDARLSALVWLYGSTSASVEILVGGYGLPPASPPHWQGQAALIGDASAGRVVFTNLAQTRGYSNADWPATVSGEVSWSCVAWSQLPPESLATSPSPAPSASPS